MTQQNPTDSNFPVVPALVFFGALALILAALFASNPTVGCPKTGTPAPVVISVATVNTAPEEVTSARLDSAKVAAGESTFQSVCAACHGFNAKGIPGLGKPLIGSPFANSLSDDDLLAFIQKGRPVTDPLNTTGVQMPPRGGNPSLTDDNLRSIIAYIRSLNGVEVAAVPAAQQTALAAAPTVAPAEFNAGAISALLGTSNTSEATETPALTTSAPTSFTSPGAADFVQACAGCHGVDSKGQPMLTKPLSDSDLVKSMNTFGIINLFTTAHPPSIEFQHPYRGGYPELSDNQLLGIVTYLITLPK